MVLQLSGLVVSLLLSVLKSSDQLLRQIFMRKYQPIWDSIKKARFNTEVPIRIHKNMEQTLIQAVRKEKAMDNAVLRRIGSPSYGNLSNRTVSDRTNPDFVIVYFKIAFNEHLI